MPHDRPAPVRVQYRKGQQLASPNGLPTAYVGRPTVFGNPFKVGSAEAPTRARAVQLFERYLASKPELRARARHELKGKNLACWCPIDSQPCHAATLLRVANAPGKDGGRSAAAACFKPFFEQALFLRPDIIMLAGMKIVRLSHSDVDRLMIASIAETRRRGFDLRVLPFRPDDVDGVHTDRRGVCHSVWFRLLDGRVFDCSGHECDPNPSLYDTVQR